MTKSLLNKIKSFPKTPGVYQFIDQNDGILYIGKAKNLQSRIKSYFAKEVGRGPAIDMMIGISKDIKWIDTESEIEAILLEAELINKLKPKYNIRLRDDKSFLVIKITKPQGEKPLCHSRAGNAMARGSKIVNLSVDSRLRGNDRIGSGDDGMRIGNDIAVFPCVELVRFKNVDFTDKSAWYFGPYPSGLLLKKSLYYLRKIFPYRDCSKTKYNTYRKKGRPCIYGDIRVCTAPCVDWVNEAEYKKNIDFLKDFLRGKKDSIIKKLNIQMTVLSKKKRFEEAGLVRNKLYGLEHLKNVAVGLRDDVFNSENVLFPRIECYDISNIGEKYAVGSMVVFSNGKPDKDEYRKFRIKNQESRIQDSAAGVSDLSRLKEMLERRFKNDWLLPNLMVIDGGEMQLKVAIEVLKNFGLKIPTVSISKGKKRDKNEFHFSDEPIAKYVKKNISLQNVLIQSRDEAHRFAISYYRSLHKKGLFK